MTPPTPGLFSLRRLLLGLIAVGLMALPVYVFILDPGRDEGIRPARLLQTQPLAGGDLGVGVAEGKLAPDFEISTPSGERVRLSELRGRPVIVNFWAQWCTSCLSEMPEIKALQEQRGVDALTVLAVNAGETPGEAREFIDFLQAPFIFALDTDLTITDAYGVYGLPLSVFIDSQGVIRGVYNGHAKRDILTMLTDAAINASPPGPIPPALRIISTIERQRFLDVSDAGTNRVRLESRSLRCDISYCADNALTAVVDIGGVQRWRRESNAAILVDFDPAKASTRQVTEGVATILRGLDDPVYKTDLVVRGLD